MVARCEGSCLAVFSENTVTSFAPRLAGRRHVRRHQAEVGLRRADRQHRPHRLQHFAGREARERRFHGRDEIAHRQQGLDLLFGQEAEVLGHEWGRWTPVVPDASGLCWREW